MPLSSLGPSSPPLAQPSSILLIPVVGLGLAWLLKTTFSKFSPELRLFDPRQLKDYAAVVADAGAVSIWTTVAIGFLNLTLVSGSPADELGCALFVSVLIVGVAAFKERGSSRHVLILIGFFSSLVGLIRCDDERKA